MLLCPALLLCSSIWLGLRLCAGFSNQDYLTLSLQSLTPPRAVALPYSHADSADLSSTQLFLLAAGCAAGPSPVSPLLFWFVDSWMLLQIHRICRVSKRLQTSGREHLLDLEIVIASAAGEGCLRCLFFGFRGPKRASTTRRAGAVPGGSASVPPSSLDTRHVSRSESSADCQGLTKRGRGDQRLTLCAVYIRRVGR